MAGNTSTATTCKNCGADLAAESFRWVQETNSANPIQDNDKVTNVKKHEINKKKVVDKFDDEYEQDTQDIELSAEINEAFAGLDELVTREGNRSKSQKKFTIADLMPPPNTKQNSK